MKRVGILLSSYNGEKYISQQIDSILAQEEVEVALYVRDDGSTDKTIDIVGDYQSNHDNIVLIKGDNIGVGPSFMELVYTAAEDFDYYAFADQDDIWDADKLSGAIRVLEDSGKMLYTSNQMCIDAQGNELGMRYGENEKVNTKFLEVFACNMLAGCTMVFTKELKQLLSQESRRPDNELLKCRIHDVWVINIAALYDSVVYDVKSHMQYRQHENNVVGAYSGGVKRELQNKINKLNNKESRNGRSRLAKEIVDKFSDVQMPEIIVRSANPKTMKNKLYLLMNMNSIISNSGEAKVGLALKLLFGLY